MNIIIAGAGKVGFNLAKTLSIGHNVTVIDKNQEAIYRIQESLDIMPLHGDVESSKTYELFIDKKIDLFIAVTNADNINLIATLMADSVLDIERKFVRIKNNFYGDTLIKEKLGISEMIYPIKLASKSIVSLLKYPFANNVKFFNYTPYKLISTRTSATLEPTILSSNKFAIVGIERDKSFFIPKDDEEIYANDLVYFFGLEEEIKSVCKRLKKTEEQSIQKCVVFGADELGVAIAKELVDANRDVKLVEKDLTLCEKADEILGGKASVINSRYGMSTLFEDESLDSADIFISATNNDEYNITKCLEAREKGISKVMAINNEMEYYSLMHSLDIIIVRGPKMSAYNKILEEVNSTEVVIEKSFCGSKANIQMRKIFPSSPHIGRSVKPIKLGSSKLYYMRDSQLFDFKEKIILQEGDLIVAFCTTKENPKVKQWIYEL
ncbi:Trk system potassium uptake protein TrkA [hydrothermal vent metagenome]|uniref:Trk system potassium uptake protein TrkA n=1 Tax=hydrothermal vent metagenome TaxID=652676 RepID=A0A1W1CC70_9ZZZZ